jgi:hypothetical protein
MRLIARFASLLAVGALALMPLGCTERESTTTTHTDTVIPGGGPGAPASGGDVEVSETRVNETTVIDRDEPAAMGTGTTGMGTTGAGTGTTGMNDADAGMGTSTSPGTTGATGTGATTTNP